MAQQDDGSGRAPVVIVRPTTSVTSGVAVTQKLVGAAVAFGDILRRTFGPNGLDKMMYKTNGENAITNDGAKIVADLLVKHPAAKAFRPTCRISGKCMWRWSYRLPSLCQRIDERSREDCWNVVFIHLLLWRHTNCL
jgi:hypothetical protein